MEGYKIKRFNFSERLKLQKEYEEFLKEESAKVGACLCASSVHSFIAFIHSKGIELVTKEVNTNFQYHDTDPVEFSFTPDTNEEMLNRASKVHSDNQPIVDPVFESINKIRENY